VAIWYLYTTKIIKSNYYTYHYKEWHESDQTEKLHHQLSDKFHKWNLLPDTAVMYIQQQCIKTCRTHAISATPCVKKGWHLVFFFFLFGVMVKLHQIEDSWPRESWRVGSAKCMDDLQSVRVDKKEKSESGSSQKGCDSLYQCRCSNFIKYLLFS